MTVTVVGRGRVAVVPDLALVDLACEGTGEDPASALSAASEGLDAVRRALASGGVAEADLRSAELGLWSESDPQGRPRGYRASVALRAAVRDLARAGDLVTAAVRAGGTTSRLRGLSLEATGAAAARAEARDLAWADALSTAGQLVARSGRSLGRVSVIVDGEPAGPGPVPVGRAFALAKDSGPQLDAGQLDITAAVTVTWELG